MAQHDKNRDLAGGRRSCARRSFDQGGGPALPARTGSLDGRPRLLRVQRSSVAGAAVRLACAETDTRVLFHPIAPQRRLEAGRSLLLKAPAPAPSEFPYGPPQISGAGYRLRKKSPPDMGGACLGHWRPAVYALPSFQ